MKDILKIMAAIVACVVGLFSYLLVTVTVLSVLLHLLHLSPAWLPVVWGGLVFMTGYVTCDWVNGRRHRVTEAPVPGKLIMPEANPTSSGSDLQVGHKADL